MSDVPRPPRRAERLLERVLAGDDAADTILGDLHQEFDERVCADGAIRARCWYWAVAAEIGVRYRLRTLRRGLPGAREGEGAGLRTALGDFLGDLRFGFRMLRKTPLVSLAAVLTIAVGIGMTVQTFSIVYGSVLRGVPVPGEDRLIQVRTENPDTGTGNMPVPYHDFLEIRQEATTLESVGSFYTGTLNLAGEGGPPERHDGGWVSADALSSLGVPPELGRVFLPGEDREAAEPLLLLSWELWQTRFAGDPDVVGRTVRANGETATIIGVMPRGFRFPFDQDAWMADRRDPDSHARHAGQWVNVFARLRPGSGIESADEELAALSSRLRERHPEAHGARTAYAVPFEEVFMPRGVTLALELQLLAVLGVLLIACGNVANLLLARSAVRSREVAVRRALGASRIRVVRQLLLETLVVAGVGAALGVGLAKLGLDAWNLWIAGIQRPYWIDIRIDGPALAVAVGATLAATVVSGLLPALRATAGDGGAILQDDGRGSSLRLGRLSSGLVVAEVALSAALLVLAGLMIKSIVNADNVDLGFATEGVLTARLGVFEADYPDAGARLRFFRQLLERLDGAPGVSSAALATHAPGLGAMRLVTSIEGESYPTDADYPLLNAKVVSEGYFETLGVEPVRGRAFRAADALDEAEAVALVNESLARRYFPGGALDRRIRVGPEGTRNRWLRIVGVVPDLHVGGNVGGLGDDRVDPATYYLPMGLFDLQYFSMILRGDGDPEGLVPTARAVVADLDPNVPIYEVAPLERALERATWAIDLFGGLFSTLGFVALFLAAVGLYGVMAFTVARRTREVGIRMALGAGARDVVWLVLGRGARQLGLGLALGLGLGALISRPLAAVTFDVHPGDPGVYLAILVLLSATGLVATLAPARRATRVDPSEALRSE